MKKLLPLLLLFTCLSIVFTSCKKDDPQIFYPITGLWVGTYSLPGDSQPPLYFSLDIHSDSTIIIQGQGGDGVTYYQYGKWSLNGTAFSGTTVTTEPFGGNNAGVIETENAIYDKTKDVLNGTWQTPYWTGSFSVERVY